MRKFGLGLSEVPSFHTSNKFLELAVKNYAKLAIKIFRFCTILPNILDGIVGHNTFLVRSSRKVLISSR